MVYRIGGSSNPGFGYVFQGQQRVVEGYKHMFGAEVFDTEVEEARHELLTTIEYATALPGHKPGSTACLDNTAAIWCLQGTPADTSQETFGLLEDYKNHGGQVTVRWVPGHKVITSNEQDGGRRGRDLQRLHQENHQTD